MEVGDNCVKKSEPIKPQNVKVENTYQKSDKDLEQVSDRESGSSKGLMYFALVLIGAGLYGLFNNMFRKSYDVK